MTKTKLMRTLILTTIATACAATLTACRQSDDDDEYVTPLDAPLGVSIGTDDILRWNAVDGASGYIVDIDGTSIHTDETSIDFFERVTDYGTYIIKVKARSLSADHTNSAWSVPVRYEISKKFLDDVEVKTYNEKNVLVVNNKRYIRGKIVIPQEIDGKTIDAIAGKAFSECKRLTSMIVPDTVKDFDAKYQDDDDNANIGGIVEDFLNPGRHYINCTALRRIKLPKDITIIDESMFEGCSSLESLDIPDNVVRIFSSAFSGCSSLKTVKLPRALANYGSFDPDYFSGGYNRYDSNPFGGCSSLESITIDASNEYFTADGKFVICKEDKALLTALDGNIPDGVEKIAGYAFCDINKIKSVSIPESVTEIKPSAVRGCSGIETFTVDEGNSVYAAAGNCIYKKDDDTLIVGCKTTEIPNTIKIIGQYAFYGCAELTWIQVPNGVTKIDNGAFIGTGLKSITLPASVTSAVAAFSRDTAVYSASQEYGTVRNCTIAYDGDYPYVQALDFNNVRFTAQEAGYNVPTRKGYRFDGFLSSVPIAADKESGITKVIESENSAARILPTNELLALLNSAQEYRTMVLTAKWVAI